MVTSNVNPPDLERGIVLTCEGGHVQRVALMGMTKEMAEDYGQILDGTSYIYLYPPRKYPMEESKLGKCGICGAWYKATTFGY